MKEGFFVHSGKGMHLYAMEWGQFHLNGMGMVSKTQRNEKCIKFFISGFLAGKIFKICAGKIFKYNFWTFFFFGHFFYIEEFRELGFSTEN